MAVPKKLEQIKDYIVRADMRLSSSFADGRVNARINEDEVIKLIRSRFSINVPKSRAWYDFSIEEDEVFYPVNIKITETTSADNLNCKLGIYYALTGKIPDFPNEVDWLDYFERLKANINENSKDYYFLVINKSDITDIFVNSLKALTKLQPNGNNLPFQCEWNINKTMKVRDFDDAKSYILKTFGKSIRLRAEIFFIFKRLFNEYL
jgi:hypothetical protein